MLTIDIDGERAAELNQFQSKLEATLILHVGLGKEHFVPVSAIYGTSLRFSLRLQFFLGLVCPHGVGDLRDLPLRD